jgi:hypothetical protein
MTNVDADRAMLYLRLIHFDFQFEMREAVAHDVDALFPARLERRLLHRLGA